MTVGVFYHLTRSAPEAVLFTLLPRALAQGWPVMLRGTDRAHLERLDTALWTRGEESFLPHGLEGGPSDADQPVLLGLGGIANQAKGLVLLDGAEPVAGELAGLERLWVLFDGNDTAAVAQARGLWSQLTGDGHGAQYWSEESGAWEKKSEKPARIDAPSS